MIRIVSSSAAAELLTRRPARLSQVEEIVRPIIDDVRAHGDEAVLRYARKFDRLDRVSPLIPARELHAAEHQLDPSLRTAILEAGANIRMVAEQQMPRPWSSEISPGLKVGQIVRPIDAVCAYVPSGRYPLISTLIMTVVTAQTAGVKEIWVTTPSPAPDLLGTAALLGVTGVWSLGGAHAIAAFAFGTGTIPRVDRIVGPGSIYVAAAKKLLAGDVGIDFVAGPTEIVILARSGNARWIAADMLAQAEHDVESASILLTTSADLARAVAGEIERQLENLPTAAVARTALEANGAIVVVESMREAIELSNRFAPEHVSIDDPALLQGIQHAGSVFIGPFSPEAAGDYASGPNHVLPTGGAARLRGGLSSADFVKLISFQELTSPALNNLSKTVTTLARAEGLEAHARSVEVRRHD